MPELPEVETIRLTLIPKLLNRTIVSGVVLNHKMIQDLSPEAFLAQIQGRKILELSRRGKYLLIQLDQGLTLSFHLRMTGQLSVENIDQNLETAIYLKLLLDNGTELRFRDQRKFGKVYLFTNQNIPSGIEKLGPEPLEADFTVEKLRQQLAPRKLAIKKALLDQNLIAGIGNIYADEALFTAGIHPARPVESLTDQELINLHSAIRAVLFQGIQYRGTTKKDYRDGNGNAGSNQEHLQVYGRKGLPCLNCQAPIVKMQFAGRGTHFCPLCQN